MTELRRMKTGNFDIKDSIKLYDFLKLEYNMMLDKIISIEDYFIDSKKVNLNKDEYTKFLNGVKFDINTQDKIVKVYFKEKFRGLGIVEDKVMKRYIID